MEPITEDRTDHLAGDVDSERVGFKVGRILDRVARSSWDSLIAFLAPLLLYVETLAPTIYNLDSAELTTAAYTGGLLRATGYPLYLLVGRAWSRLPVGDVGFRMNLLSAVCGALTVLLAYRVLRRLGVGGWSAFGALGLLTCSQYFWGLSLIAEVYTPHTALLAGILLLLLRFQADPTPHRLAATTFLFGLSAGHHMATVLMAPACTWFVLQTGGKQSLRPRFLLPAVGALAAGLSVYAYLPLVYLQEPVFNYAGQYGADGVFSAVDLTTADGLWWLVSGQAFSDQMMGYGGSDSISQVSHLGGEIWRAFVAVGVGPGLLGLIVLWRRQRAAGTLLLLIFLFHTIFYVNYAVGDKDTMFLPSYLVWSLWLGVGYEWLLQWVRKQRAPHYLSSPETGVTLLRMLIVSAVFFSLALNAPLVDQSRDRSSRRRAETIIATMDPGSLLIGWWDTVPAVEYLQLVEGRGGDVTAINRFLIDLPDLRRLVQDRLGVQTIYLDEPPGEALPGVLGIRAGPLYRLIRSPGSVVEDGTEQIESSL